MSSEQPQTSGRVGALAGMFLNSKLTPLLIVVSVLAGVFAVWMLPREEEPQIQVPMVDVMVALPGATAEETESRVTRPLEQILWEVPGVEYLYSSSRPGQSLVTVRYQVGWPLEQALVRLDFQLRRHADRWAPEASQPIMQARTIDDVPVLALTFHSAERNALELRALVQQVEEKVKGLADIAETRVIGGDRRQVRVQLDSAALAALGISPFEVASALEAGNLRIDLGSRPWGGREVELQAGSGLGTAADVAALVVAERQGRTVTLGEVAAVVDGSEEPRQRVLHLRAAGGNTSAAGGWQEAVTLSLAKRPGANAITVVEAVLAQVDTLHGWLLPEDVEVTITRDYGHTAAEKSNELLLHMGIAVFGVAILIFLFLGWRESLVVLLAIPTTLALTLLVFYLYGYTLNRITLFALIFSIGILVDDAIVVVENIVRHIRLPGARTKTFSEIAIEAVEEVGQPTILATWAVIAAILPMAFVGGLMGPYMRPIPIGATAAMLFSLIVALTVTPWAAIRLLRRNGGGHGGGDGHPDEVPDDILTRLYHKVMDPMLDHRWVRWTFLGGIVALLAGAMGLVGVGVVQVKMLPFDNKSEFQVIIDPPEGTTLQETTRLAQELAELLLDDPTVRDIQLYAGTSAPFNFNGLVRHYFLRQGPHVADLQVNLVDKGKRRESSHEVALRVRPRLAEHARLAGAEIAVAEVPPGPPVMQTIVAEVYGPDDASREQLAAKIRRMMEETAGVVDVGSTIEAARTRWRWEVDAEKAARHGLTPRAVVEALALAQPGQAVGRLRDDSAREEVPIWLELAESERAAGALDGWWLPTAGPEGLVRVPLAELVSRREVAHDPVRFRKNLQPVIYVTGDVAGEIESPAYALIALQRTLRSASHDELGVAGADLAIFHLIQPIAIDGPALKWDGEWHITLEVFRDLGLAFVAVLGLIAVLMVGWFKSYSKPLVVMAAIPFSLIGIMPGHALFGAFFTATSMIGFMAGAGIVVRNSIILVDFIELRRRQGLDLRNAVVEAGAVRFRPMLLTALAVVVATSVILADPIFQGLAISLMFGEIASLLISRMAVPVLYFMSESSRRKA